MKRAIALAPIYLGMLVCLIVGTALADNPMPVTSCGTVITVAGKYILANNLVSCSGTGVLIQTSNVTLLLNGYTISAQVPSFFVAGVAVGDGTTNVSVLGPGVITNYGVGLALGSSSSVVANVTATQNINGFDISPVSSVVQGNTATANINTGFAVHGKGNVVRGNDSSSNGGSGFVVEEGIGNEIRGNTANANSQDGILVDTSSIGNTIRGNTALGNNTSGGTFYDLKDNNANCDSNIWQGNDFVTVPPNQSCIH